MTMETVRVWIVAVFSAAVLIAFLSTLAAVIYFRNKDPKSDVSVFYNIMFTCLGYIVGIMTGILGIANPAAPQKKGDGGAAAIAPHIPVGGNTPKLGQP